MNDYSTTLTGTPVQVVPPAKVSRNLLILSAPGPSNTAGGNGDVCYSFTLTGAAVVPGAPGTFLLQGGQTVQMGGGGTSQTSGFVPTGPIWACPVRGTSAALTAITNDYGAP